MKIKSGFVVQKVGSSYLAVAVGERADDFNAMIRMNSTGAFVWEQLSARDMTEDELVASLVAEYSIPTELAARDIASVTSALRGAGLLDE